MSRTLVALFLAAGVVAAAEPTKAELDTAAIKLKAFRDKVGKADGAFSASDLSTAKDDKDRLPNADKAFEKGTEKLPGLKQPAANLAKLAEDKTEATRKQAAKTFLTALESAKPKEAYKVLEATWKEVTATKAGTVGEGSSDEFKMTAAELAKDAKAAQARAAKWQAAMEENAKRLTANHAALLSLAARAKSNHESLVPTGKNIDQFIQKGMVPNFGKDVEKFFDLGKRDDFKMFADAATEKAAEVKKALDAQKKQIEAIKQAVKLLDAK